MSNRGDGGEQAAAIWCQRHGWDMDNVEPPTRVVKINGKVAQVPVKGGAGVFDLVGLIPRESVFTGWRGDKLFALEHVMPCYAALEVKEATTEDTQRGTMRASRLSKAQRAWADRKPAGCCFVGILWGDGLFEVHPYVPKGSYKHGEGLAI